MFPCLRRTPEEGTNRNNNLQLEQTPDPDMRGQNRGSDIDRGRRGKQEEGEERGEGLAYRGRKPRGIFLKRGTITTAGFEGQNLYQ